MGNAIIPSLAATPSPPPPGGVSLRRRVGQFGGQQLLTRVREPNPLLPENVAKDASGKRRVFLTDSCSRWCLWAGEQCEEESHRSAVGKVVKSTRPKFQNPRLEQTPIMAGAQFSPALNFIPPSPPQFHRF